MRGDSLDPREQQLTEACDSLWDALVDPREAYVDDDGLRWNRLGAGDRGGPSVAPALDEEQLADVRLDCRRLAATNEF